MLEQLFSVIWEEEIVLRQWRESLIVNYRGITLLRVVGKVFCKILNNRLVQSLEKKEHCMRDMLVLELTEIE